MPIEIEMNKFRPMKTLRPHLRKIEASLNTRRDAATGFVYQQTMGHRVFLKSTQDYIKPKLLEWLAREIYFKFYLPNSGDTVVDVGAGLGHEAVWLGTKSGTKKYFGVEIQPSIYECLCNTMHQAGFGHKAIGTAISDQTGDLHLHSSGNYQNKSTLEEDGYISVPTMRWCAFQEKFGISKIDLLKINIEGGEKYLLPAIGDYSNIRRIIVSAHDFRADAGDGEHFRTREFVKEFLDSKGYRIRPVGSGWLGDWLFADQV